MERSTYGAPSATATRKLTSRQPETGLTDGERSWPATESTDDRELFSRWHRDRDRAARDELVTRYLRLARSLALRYRGANEPLDDLVQVASVGLVKAIDRFDPERGLPFTAFAVPTILGELKRYFRDHCWAIHVPRGAKERAINMQAATHELASTLGRSPTVMELAEYSEVPLEHVLDGLEAAAAHHSLSLDTPLGQDVDAPTLADTLGEDDRQLELTELAVDLGDAVSRLTGREQKVLRLRFHGGLSQTEIAREVGVSQMQVSRILSRALAQLRDSVDPPECGASDGGNTA